MTSPLRRRRPTTAPAPSPTPTRTAGRGGATPRGGVTPPLLAGLGLLLWAGLASAQQPGLVLTPIAPPAVKAPRSPRPHDHFADDQTAVRQAAAPPGTPDVGAGQYQGLVEPPSSDVLFGR